MRARWQITERLGNRDGATAVEFALLSPILFLLLLGIVSYGYVLTIDHGLQQLAAEAARASVAGMSDRERETIARAAVATSVGSYGVLDAGRLQVDSAPLAGSGFRVSLTYDLRDLFFTRLAPWLPLPTTELKRSAAIQRGGY